MRLYSEKEGEMKITEEITGKLRKHGNKMILAIRGEDIKFDPQNIDVYKENKMNAVVDNTEIMGNENNCPIEGFQEPFQPVDGFNIQVVRRFVEQQQIRPLPDN